MNKILSVVRGTGSYLPDKILTNLDLEKMVETSDDWIFQRTGIKSRHIAAKDQTTSMMAIQAAQKALEAANLNGADIDGVVVATTSADKSFPSVAVMVQSALGVGLGPCFDVQAVCSGFIYALNMADLLIKNGQAQRLLVIGAEKFSSLIDWTDRTTCVLFGDGAGAVILEAKTDADSGIISSHLHADGNERDILYTTGGISSTGTIGTTVMLGQDVFKQAIKRMAEVVEETLKFNNLSSSQIDWLIPHQANLRIIEGTARKLSMPMEKVVVTVQNQGNTSAASIPLALDAAVRDGRIKRGQLLLLEALGAGLTWGATLIRY